MFKPPLDAQKTAQMAKCGTKTSMTQSPPPPFRKKEFKKRLFT